MKKTWNIFSKRYWTKENLWMNEPATLDLKDEYLDLKQEWKKFKAESKMEYKELKQDWQQDKTEIKEDFRESKKEFQQAWKELKQDWHKEVTIEEDDEEEQRQGILTTIGKWMQHLGYKAAKLKWKTLIIFTIPVLLYVFFAGIGLLIGLTLAAILLSSLKMPK